MTNKVILTEEEIGFLVEIFHQICNNEALGFIWIPLFREVDKSDEFVGALHTKLEPFLSDGTGNTKIEIERELTEIEKLFVKYEVPDSLQESGHLWSDYLHSVKVGGTYPEAVQYMEERLTHREYVVLAALSEWLTDNNYGMGHNYFERFIQFLKEKTNDKKD